MRRTATAALSPRFRGQGLGQSDPAFLISDSVPASVGGWDTLSPIAKMPPDHAVVLDNWIPRPGYLELRRGSDVFAPAPIGSSSPCETIMAYNAGNTSNSQLFAAVGSVIYQVTGGSTANGALSAWSNGFSDGFGTFKQVATGFSVARWQYVNFSNSSSNHYLIAVNGTDHEQIYDGTSFANTTWTGPTAGQIVHIAVHKGRLWLVPNNSTLVWYLAVGAISGAATSFELGDFMTKGGYIQAIATWSVDVRQTVDDYLAFITSRGQIIVYAGTDPSSTNTWALIGVYDVGTPIGRRCFLRVAGDLFLITLDGILPMSQMLSTDRSAANRVSLTAMIMDTFRQATLNYSGNFGWQFVAYPAATLAIANIPTGTDSSAQQYVMNTLTGAWCRFLGMDAICWEIFNDKLYFGKKDGSVWLFDRDSGDGANAITATVQSAFNYFGQRGRRKRFTMVRPLLTTDHKVKPGIGINVDYGTGGSVSVPAFSGIAGAQWDSASWDSATWPGESVTTSDWQSLSGEGFCASFITQVSSVETGLQAGIVLRLNGFDVTMEPSSGYL